MNAHPDSKHLTELEATGCTLLRDIKQHTVVNIYGLVTGFKPPRKTKGTDYVCSLTIADPSRGLGETSDTSINLFHQNQSSLPSIKSRGDMLVLKKARVQSFQNKLQCISAKGYTTWAVITRSDDGSIWPVELPGMVLSLDDGDIRVIKILQDWATEIVRSKTGNHTQSAQTQANIPQPILPLDSNKRRRTIAEITRSRMFLDLVAEVVAFFHDTERGVSQLMLVDYTINEQLGEHAVDRFGVSGRRIIMCTLYDEHHTECPPLAVGNFVIVRNANSKVDRNQIMELRVNGDRSRKLMRCGVRLLEMGDPQLVPLLERRQEYLRSMLQEQGRQKLLPMVESKAKVWTVTKHKDIKETPLRAIALSKMAVERFKVRACVVGYKPANIKDMVRPWCSKCGQSVSPRNDPSILCAICNSPMSEYKFQFACLLQDVQGAQLPVIFYDTDAEYFLSSSTPPNLYTDEDAASELKEQIDAMCPSGKSSNVWMDFCIQSYEVAIDGKKDRRFRVFDTELKIH